MLDLKKTQKEIYKNKVKQGFNVKDIYLEFCYILGELAEAFEAYNKKKGGLGEELADIVIHLLGLAEILGIDLEKEITKKIKTNKKRKYVKKNGVRLKIKD